MSRITYVSLISGILLSRALAGDNVFTHSLLVTPGTDIQLAIDTAAAQSGGEPFEVVLAPGRHRITSTVRITEKHSHMMLRGLTGAIVDGGMELPPFTDLGNGVWKTNMTLPPHASFPTVLVVNGQRRIRARMPNAINATAAGMNTDNTTFHALGPLVNCTNGVCPAADSLGFQFDPADPLGMPSAGWNYTNSVSLIWGFWGANWLPVASVIQSNNTLLFATPAGGPLAVPRSTRWVLENMRELLDAPGEFWMDQDTNEVFYIPMPGETINNVTASVPTQPSIFGIEGSNYSSPVVGVSVHNIDVTTWGEWQPTARYGGYPAFFGGISIQNAANISITNVTLYAGVTAGILHHGNVNGLLIDRVRVTDVGANGIGGYDGSPNVTNVYVSNCIIDNIGNVYYSQPTGIQVTGKNVTVQHNLIYNVPYAGISLGLEPGSAVPANATPAEFLFDISYNRVDNYGLGIMSDLAGIYAVNLGNCWLTTGCWVPANIHHNVISNGRHYAYGSTGVYVDQDMAGVWIHHNIVYDTGSVSLSLHCGMNNTVYNNIFYGPERQLTGSKFGVLAGCFGFPSEVHSSSTFNTNIVVATDTAYVMNGAYDNYYCWAGHYDWFADNNVYWGLGANAPPLHYANHTLGLPAWRAICGADMHSVEQDPLLADPASGNFTVLPGSPAWALGWQVIDTSTVGPL